MKAFCAVAGLVLLLTGGAVAQERCDPDDWTGRWSTAFGSVWLTNHDGAVDGLYEVSAGRLQGTLDATGCLLTGTWRQDGEAGEIGGPFSFLLDRKGYRFEGTWANSSEPDVLGEWDGEKVPPTRPIG